MRLARDVKMARSISVTMCDFKGCNCGAVYVRFHDDDGQVFAMGVMKPEVAIEFAGDIVSEAEQMPSRGPQMPECQRTH